MKRVNVRLVVLSLLLLSMISGFAQPVEPFRYKVLPAFTLPISQAKTTSLLFPYAIKSVDMGSSDVLAQIAKGAENVLQIKSARRDFQSTSLSVITADGRFFPFVLEYVENPELLNLSFMDEERSDKVRLLQVLLDDATLNEVAGLVANEPAFLHRSTRQQGIRLMLEGLHLYKESLWFSLNVFNKTWINYEPASIRFFIQDRKRSKRTAIQEKEITPIYLSKEINTAGGNTTKLVMAFPVFTIPKGQQLVIRMAEKGGGRNLSLAIRPKTILKTMPLPEQ